MAKSVFPEPSTGVPKGDSASRPGSPSLGDVYSNTETGYLEVYIATGWSQLGVIPLSATIGTAANVADTVYGLAVVDVPFTPNEEGGLASLYTATSSPGGITGTGTSSPVRVTGLTNATAYTFTITATNGYGNALASSSSNSVTAATVPQAPTITSASEGDLSAVIAFTAGATGGSAITGYTVTSSPGGFTATGSSSPLTVTGLTNGTSYTFSVTATNAIGTSAASTASSSVVPKLYALSQTFTSSGTYTVPSGKTRLAAYVVGGGASAGGAGGGGVAFKEYAVSPGQQYTVTVGGTGTASSFGNLANANGASGSTAGSGASNVAGAVTALGGSTGSINGETLTLTAPGLTSIQVGGKGGDGGAGASKGFSSWTLYGPNAGGGAAGGLVGGGAGGSGGGAGANGPNSGVFASAGSAGTAGTAGTGGGGGAGGGGGYIQTICADGCCVCRTESGAAGANAAGGSGKVVVYVA